MSDQMMERYVRGHPPQGFRGWLMVLVNPFTYVAGWQALAGGVAVLAATVVVAVSGRIHYDGVVDLHISSVTAPAWLYAFEPVADWLIVALVFCLAGRLFSRSKQRVIDYFGTTAVARFPYLIAGMLWMPSLLGGVLKPFTDARMSAEEALGLAGLPWVVIGGLFTVVLIAWLAMMNYFALKESSGMKSPKAVWVFIVAAIVAEVVSKVALGLTAKGAGVI